MAKIPNLQEITTTDELKKFLKVPKLIKLMAKDVVELTVADILTLAGEDLYENGPHTGASLSMLLMSRMTAWADKPENQ